MRVDRLHAGAVTDPYFRNIAPPCRLRLAPIDEWMEDEHMRSNRTLWIIQGLLAVVFLFAGGAKFAMSAEQMNAGASIQLPGWFLHFIGVCEVLGAIGLIVPGLTGIQPQLTPISAAGLVIIMIGAVTI